MSDQPERNLVIVHSPTLQALSDFLTVKAKLAERAPDIEVFIADNRGRCTVTRRQAARRPSLVFSPIELVVFRPLRGKVYAGRTLTKMEEYERLAGAGLPVPRAVMVEPETRLDPVAWGPFTVLKPNRGRQGRGVRVVRTRDVAWRDPASWPSDDPRFGQPMLAQQFIDTGAFPVSYRVMTVFGRVVYASCNSLPEARPFDRDPAGVEPVDEPVAANVDEGRTDLTFREDILATARAVAAGLPDMAVLGIDLVCEAATGRIFVLEVNPTGKTWHISSSYGVAHQRKSGVDYQSQFGALDVVADALIEVTRREAE